MACLCPLLIDRMVTVLPRFINSRYIFGKYHCLKVLRVLSTLGWA